MIIKPETVYIDGDVKIDDKAVIMPFCVIKGSTEIGEDTVVCSFSHIEDSKIGKSCKVGPYARLRSNAVVGDNCRIGNFVEIKNSLLESGVKAAHLAYIGDAQIGSGSNIGCGVIFCNYDGVKKHKTVVGENCFIGSNVNLIAPVSIGGNSFIAAGTTVCQSLPERSFVKGNRELRISRNKKIP